MYFNLIFALMNYYTQVFCLYISKHYTNVETRYKNKSQVFFKQKIFGFLFELFSNNYFALFLISG